MACFSGGVQQLSRPCNDHLPALDLAACAAGWGTGAEEKDLIDVGWFSVWVKFVTQWVTVATYCWMLVAPTLYPDREYL